MVGESPRRVLFLATGVLAIAALVVVAVFATEPVTTPSAGAPQPSIVVKARGQTEPVAETGDAADDPAIWVHPGDPARSLILGTDKKDGLNVYDLDGRLLNVVSPARARITSTSFTDSH